MPLPTEYWKEEERKKHGWFKKVIYERIVRTRAGNIYQKWQYDAVQWGVCSNCRSPEWIYLNVRPSGVYKACLKCGITTGPLPTDEGAGDARRLYAELLEEKIITEKEAAQIYHRLGFRLVKGVGWVP